jgi:glutamate racemase
LVLGCTHFPALAPVIRAVLPAEVCMVDSAATTAAAVCELIAAADGAAGGASDRAKASGLRTPGTVSWLATDGAARFARVGSTFLGELLQPQSVELIDL